MEVGGGGQLNREWTSCCQLKQPGQFVLHLAMFSIVPLIPCAHDVRAFRAAQVMQKGDPYKLNMGLGPVNITKNLAAWNGRMYAWTCYHFAQLAGGVVGKDKVGRADHTGVRVVPVLGVNGGYAPDGENKLSWLYEAWGAPAAAGLATVNMGGYVGAAKEVVANPSSTKDEIITSLLSQINRQTPTTNTAYVDPPLFVDTATLA